MSGSGGSRAQVGLEYLVISAFLLVAVGILFYFSLSSFSTSSASSSASTAVAAFTNAADRLAGLGPGSALSFPVDFPEGTVSLVPQGRQLVLGANIDGETRYFYAYAEVDLNAVSLNSLRGRHVVRARFENGVVNFYE